MGGRNIVRYRAYRHNEQLYECREEQIENRLMIALIIIGNFFLWTGLMIAWLNCWI